MTDSGVWMDGGSKNNGGPVATRTPDLYRVKVALVISIRFQSPKWLRAARLGRFDKTRKKKARRGECRAGRGADTVPNQLIR